MKDKGLISYIYTASEWILRIAYINILWIVYTLVGLVFFGIFPATIAMLLVTKELFKDKEVISIGRVFYQNYRKMFMKSNKMGILFLLVGFVLYVDIFYIIQFNGLGIRILQILLLSICIFYINILLNSLLLLSYKDMPLKELLKKATVLCAFNPLRGGVMLLFLVALIGVSLAFPTLFIFFSFGLFGFFLLKIGAPMLKGNVKIKGGSLIYKEEKI